jgi:lipid-A-disaccharide synthase-like uncharacterized protein
MKGVWKRIPQFLRVVIALLPVCAIVFMLKDASAFVLQFLHNDKVPLWLLIYGSLGQVIFTVRFIYQWYYSYKRQRSILPVGFWIISLIGSGIIVSYGAIRYDPVLVLGQSIGFLTYSRNIVLYNKSKKKS